MSRFELTSACPHHTTTYLLTYLQYLSYEHKQNLRAAFSTSSSRTRNASISGDYFSPVPTILALISSDNTSLLAVEPSFDSSTKVVTDSSVDKGVICYLSDGGKVRVSQALEQYL